MQKLLFFLCFFLVLSLFSSSFIPVQAPETESLGNTHVNKTQVDWRRFWNLFNNHTEWDLEYNEGIGWTSIKSDLQIIKDYYMETDVDFLPANRFNGSCVKITLNFTASYAADYRLTFGIDLDVKNYTYHPDQYTYVISYQNHTVYFNFTDLTSISGLTFSHGVQPVGDDDWFWFRIRRNNVPEGYNIVLDPTFGNTGIGADWFTSWDDRLYANQYNLTEAGTVTKICLYAGDNENGNDYRLAIYNSSWSAANGRWEPDYLQGESANVTATGSGWMNATVNIELQSGEYHIAWRVAAAWGGKKDAGGTSQLCTSAAGQGSPDNNFPNDFPGIGASYNDYACSVYAVYTAAAGQDLTFIRFENLNLYSSLGITKELHLTFSELLRLFSYSFMNQEKGFEASEIISFTSSSSRAIEISRSFSETIILFSSGTATIELSIQDLYFTLFEAIRLYSSSSVAKELAFQLSETIRLHSTSTSVFQGIPIDLTFILYETIKLFTSTAELLEVAEVLPTLTEVLAIAALALIIAIVGLSFTVSQHRKE